MKRITRRIVLAAGVAAFGAPSLLHSQNSPQGAAAVRDAQEVQAWFGELEGLHTQLEAIQAQALADPQISAAQAELGGRVRDAMERLDPALAGLVDRMAAMEEEANAAQQAGDSTKLGQLVTEAEQMQRRFLSAQEKVLAQPEIAADVTAFQQRLERKMIELNPEAARIIARFRELEALLAAEAESR